MTTTHRKLASAYPGYPDGYPVWSSRSAFSNLVGQSPGLPRPLRSQVSRTQAHALPVREDPAQRV